MCLNQLKLQFSVVKSTYVVVSPTVHGFNFHFSWVKPFSYPFWGSHRPNVSQKRNSAFLTRTPRRFCSFCTMRCNSTCETKREITCVHCVHLYTDLHVVYIYMWLSTVYLYIYVYVYMCRNHKKSARTIQNTILEVPNPRSRVKAQWYHPIWRLSNEVKDLKKSESYKNTSFT